MRHTVYSAIAWLGVLQSVNAPALGIEPTARLVGIAGALGTLTTLVYRLGVWRQEMENTRNNVGAQMKAYREESSANFARIERRLDSIDRFIGLSRSVS